MLRTRRYIYIWNLESKYQCRIYKRVNLLFAAGVARGVRSQSRRSAHEGDDGQVQRAASPWRAERRRTVKTELLWDDQLKTWDVIVAVGVDVVLGVAKTREDATGGALAGAGEGRGYHLSLRRLCFYDNGGERLLHLVV